MNSFREQLSDELKRVDFTSMSVAERYNFISGFVMNYYRQDIDAARKDIYYAAEPCRRAYYYSAEFLVGRLIYSNLYNLGILDDTKNVMAEYGCDIAQFEEIPDAALGNGGLGRLAACFLDSAATQNIRLCGCGIRYKYGLFRQDLSEGYQRELPDDWTRFGDPWSIRRDRDSVVIEFASDKVRAVPYDMPVFGYRRGEPKIGEPNIGIPNIGEPNHDKSNIGEPNIDKSNIDTSMVGILRLWQSEALTPFDFTLFNDGKYAEAIAERERAERICAVLYPNDNTPEGKELRLRQQYFLTSASIRDLVRGAERNGDLKRLHELAVIQLNDTHPVLAIPELIVRLEERGIDFDAAFDIASKLFAYTNHTVMREALEEWDEELVKKLIPKVYSVIVKIQRRLERELISRGFRLDGAASEARGELDIIKDGKIKMAPLACFMGFAVNGVAALHTEILKRDVLNGWYKLYPQKFSNKTNGVTPRRWLGVANPELCGYIGELIGDGFMTELSELERLKRFADDSQVIDRFARIKKLKKEQLAAAIKLRCGINVDPEFMFDIQAKRLHEYKRQLLNALSIVDLYFGIKDGLISDFTPTAFIFGAKSAPGYMRAKAIIKFILAIAKVIDNDPDVRGLMKVVFIPDYNVSWGELLFPAGDLSEQISTAGTEASGTGNMKFMLNGCPTIGTLDGANLEIREAAPDGCNYFFGKTAEELRELMPVYDPRAIYLREGRIRRAVDSLTSGIFGKDSGYDELYKSLIEGASWHSPDNYYLLGDFYDYSDTRRTANRDFRDTAAYSKKAFLNLASAGRFSSDYTVREYAKDIWKI